MDFWKKFHYSSLILNKSRKKPDYQNFNPFDSYSKAISWNFLASELYELLVTNFLQLVKKVPG